MLTLTLTFISRSLITSHCLPSIPVSTLMKQTLLLQMLVRSHGEEKKVGITEDDNKGFLPSLLKGEYNKEESARSFQEALKLWRGKNDGVWIPARPGTLN